MSTAAISRRTFGVEIECGHEYGYSWVHRKMLEAGYSTARHGVDEYSSYSVGCDGSGVEVRTPVLQGSEGYEELEKVMDYLRKLKCYVTYSDGMHVHIGAKFLDDRPDAVRCLSRLWIANRSVIDNMVSPNRHGRSALTPELAKNLGKPCKEIFPRDHYYGTQLSKYWGSRYDLNFANIPGKGTVEFRLHEGCLDPARAVSWVQFCQKMVDYSRAKRGGVFTCASVPELLERLRVPEGAISVLEKKPRTLGREKLPA